MLGIGGVALVAVVVGFVVGGGDFVSGSGEPAPTRLEQDVSIGEDGAATMTLDPTIAGMSSLAISIRNADGSLNTRARQAHVRYRPSDERLGFFKQELASDGKGGFVADEIIVPFPGDWDFDVTVSEDEFSSALASFDARIQPNPELDA
jgi:hypothetical protein